MIGVTCLLALLAYGSCAALSPFLRHCPVQRSAGDAMPSLQGSWHLHEVTETMDGLSWQSELRLMLSSEYSL